jgi:hypothetical protein
MNTQKLIYADFIGVFCIKCYPDNAVGSSWVARWCAFLSAGLGGHAPGGAALCLRDPTLPPKKPRRFPPP